MERSGNFYKAIRLGYILISILIGCMDKEILRAMNKCFTRKNNIFVSQEVLSLLEDGWRLTCNYNAPWENDFK